MRQPDNLPAFCRVHRNGRPLIGVGHSPRLERRERMRLGWQPRFWRARSGALSYQDRAGSRVASWRACGVEQSSRLMTACVRWYGWLPEHDAAVRAAEAGDECGRGGRLDLNVGAEGGEGWHEGCGIGVLQVESFEGKPVRC